MLAGGSALALVDAAPIHVIEVRVLQGGQGRDSPVRVECDQSRQQVDLQLIERGRVLGHGHAPELGERRLEIVQPQGIRPVILVRGAQYFENFEDLINLRITHEQRSTLHHLRENAAS